MTSDRSGGLGSPAERCSKSSRVPRLKTRSRPSGRWPKPPMWRSLPASARRSSLSRASAARADSRAGADGLPVLRQPAAAQARRGRHRDARSRQGGGQGRQRDLALAAVRRIDALFEIERTINGQSAERRRVVRQELSAPLVTDLQGWLREQRRKLSKLSRGNDLAKAMHYMLKRWPAFTQFLDDGRICLSNNAAERAPWAEIVPVRGFRPRRTASRGDVQSDRHCQSERRRPAGLARRCPGPDRRPSSPQDRRTAA